MASSAIELQLNEAGYKIQRGKKLFILHNNPDGFLGVNWQGKYHLGLITESWKPDTNQFRVLWNRKGKSVQTLETLQFPDQVLTLDTVKIVSVDNDSSHGRLETAEVIDLLPDDFNNVKVRWENRRDVQMVNLSQLSTGGLKTRRKRTATNMLGFEKNVTVSGISSLICEGFTKISSHIKDDIPETVVNILKPLVDEVERGSEKYIETLKDAVELLQEELFQFSDKTKFINAPLEAKSIYNQQQNNKDQIIFMAKKSFGLSDSHITKLFDDNHLKYDHHGIYSIHDAIPVLQQMSDKCRVLHTTSFDSIENENNSDDEDEHESDNSICSESSELITRKNFQLLGRRIKTTFENGKEFEGSVTAIHYRVQYDDKENETMSASEVMQSLADNDVVFGGLSSMKEIGLSSLEIFSGCSLLSNYCNRRGMEAISIDKDVNSNATIKADFFNKGVQDILATRTHDYIHASPECKFYSHINGDKHRDKYIYNKTPEAHKADAMLLHLFYFYEKELRKNKDVTLTLENPAAWMMKSNIITHLFEKKLNMKPYKIYYCQFGRGEKKPTCIWINDECLGRILLRMGGACDCKGNHEECIRGSTRKKNFAALPIKLCNVISDYVYTKHRQLKYKKYIEK